MEYEMDLLDNEGTIASNVSIEQGDYARDPDAFGCCSRYRECSDAGKCLIPELDYSIHCAYRKNLEQGQIFYGKKAQEFSEIRYADILGKIQALSPEAREEFDSLLVNFCEYHRGTEHCIVRNHCLEELSSTGLFEFRPFSPDLDKISLEALQRIAGQAYEDFMNAIDAEKKRLRKEKQKAKKANDDAKYDLLSNRLGKLSEFPKRNTKKAVLQWFQTEAKEQWDEFLSRYAVAYQLPDAGRFLEEIWRDTVLKSYESRIYQLSPLAEDGLLTWGNWAEEEMSRVNLSHGYTQEEKSRRISDIERERLAHAMELPA